MAFVSFRSGRYVLASVLVGGAPIALLTTARTFAFALMSVVLIQGTLLLQGQPAPALGRAIRSIQLGRARTVDQTADDR